jgi:predicted negative regulator of RcsB-dependent stress response
LALVKDPAFKATADEARGDIYVAKKILSRKSLSKCMGSLERKQERQILQIKLESVGILVMILKSNAHYRNTDKS